jgi:RNA polymerase sigma factor (sigma-70 family)
MDKETIIYAEEANCNHLEGDNYEKAIFNNKGFEQLLKEDGGTFGIFRREMNKYSILKHERTMELILEAQSGNRESRDILLTHNLRLITWVAFKYRRKLSFDSAIDVLDLIQEGTMGLARAIQLFDVNLGFKFSGYAVYWIRQAITRSLANNVQIIRYPIHIIESINKYEKVCTQLNTKLLRKPTDKEIATEMETNIEKVSIIKDLISSREVASIDKTLLNNKDGKRMLSEVIAGYKNNGPAKIDNNILRDEIRSTLKKFCFPKECDILNMRFGLNPDNPEPMTLQDIGDKFNVSRERIRQIESIALDKISYLPNFIRIGLALGIRISPEIVRDAKRRQIEAAKNKKEEILLEIENLYKDRSVA